MIRLFTLVAGISLSAFSFGQVLFGSNLSSWTAGDPDGWMGSKTNIGSENVVEQTIGVTYGTAMAQLFNASASHKRFTTQDLAVTGGETYEIKVWGSGFEGSELRTGYYDVTNDGWFYNSYFDVFAETGGELGLLSQTVTIPESCTNAEFILSIRNTDELVGILVDSVSIEVTAPVEPELVSIYDIQYATEEPYASDYVDMIVETGGIVTGVFTAGGDAGRFFIQDGSGEWNGIYVYENGTEVNIGDSVTVTGTVTEFFELTEITFVSDITIHSSDNDLPAAIEVPTGDVQNEEYEGILVTVTGAECTNEDAGFGQFEVNDGSGARLIDDEIYSYTATNGNIYSVTGVTFLSFGDVKIYPRSMDDIVVEGSVSIDENVTELGLYPNPASDIVTFNVSATAHVAIYNVAGALVHTVNGNVTTIDVSAFEAGIYQVVVTDNNRTATERLIVK